jgi:hypothetical protein
MKRFIRKRPSPATIIAIVALIAALAGTAIAAGPFLPKRKFVNFKGRVLKGLTYVTTTKSVPGTGGSGVAFDVPVSASCPTGLMVIGGGIKFPDSNGNDSLAESYPTATGWAGSVDNFGGTGTPPVTATTTAICAKTKSSTGAPPAS